MAGTLAREQVIKLKMDLQLNNLPFMQRMCSSLTGGNLDHEVLNYWEEAIYDVSNLFNVPLITSDHMKDVFRRLNPKFPFALSHLEDVISALKRKKKVLDYIPIPPPAPRTMSNRFFSMIGLSKPTEIKRPVLESVMLVHRHFTALEESLLAELREFEENYVPVEQLPEGVFVCAAEVHRAIVSVEYLQKFCRNAVTKRQMTDETGFTIALTTEQLQLVCDNLVRRLESDIGAVRTVLDVEGVPKEFLKIAFEGGKKAFKVELFTPVNHAEVLEGLFIRKLNKQRDRLQAAQDDALAKAKEHNREGRRASALHEMKRRVILQKEIASLESYELSVIDSKFSREANLNIQKLTEALSLSAQASKNLVNLKEVEKLQDDLAENQEMREETDLTFASLAQTVMPSFDEEEALERLRNEMADELLLEAPAVPSAAPSRAVSRHVSLSHKDGASESTTTKRSREVLDREDREALLGGSLYANAPEGETPVKVPRLFRLSEARKKKQDEQEAEKKQESRREAVAM